MRTTINLDDELLEKAQRITGIEGQTDLIHEGLRALIERESARCLARLGGSEAQLEPAPRRRDSGRHLRLDRPPAFERTGVGDDPGGWAGADAPFRARRTGLRQPHEPE